MIILLERIEPRKKRTINDIRARRRRTFIFMISQAKSLILRRKRTRNRNIDVLKENDIPTAVSNDYQLKIEKQM